MIIQDFPSTTKVMESKIRHAPRSRGFVSPLSGDGGFARMPGDHWLASVTVTHSSFADANILSAFLAMLDGRTGAVAIGDSTRKVPKGVAAGGHVGAITDFTDGTNFSDGTKFTDDSDFGQLASITARDDDTVHIRGLVVSKTGVLQPGDWFQIGHHFGPQGSQLAMAGQAANSDANGESRVTVRPHLRRAFPVGTPVRFRNPQGVFRLQTDFDDAQARVAAYAMPVTLQFKEIMTP